MRPLLKFTVPSFLSISPFNLASIVSVLLEVILSVAPALTSASPPAIVPDIQLKVAFGATIKVTVHPSKTGAADRR